MIIPSLDLIGGKIVRLYQGKYNYKKEYTEDVYNKLLTYHIEGAKIIHLVDLDGAKNPNNRQISLLKNILSMKKFTLQIGGGIRKEQDIELLLTAGVKRVVIGSIAVKKRKLMENFLNYFGPEKIVLALDFYIDQNNFKKVSINGWQKNTEIKLEELIEYFSDFGLKHVLCTDISKDGTLLGPNIKVYQELLDQFNNIYFQSSGGIGQLNDICELKKIGIHSVIIGKSLLEKKFTVSEAISCWQKE